MMNDILIDDDEILIVNDFLNMNDEYEVFSTYAFAKRVLRCSLLLFSKLFGAHESVGLKPENILIVVLMSYFAWQCVLNFINLVL